MKKSSEIAKELVLFKVETEMSNNLKLSIGGHGSFSKKEIIEHIKKDDEIGKQIIAVHLSFLKAVANGEVASKLASIENE